MQENKKFKEECQAETSAQSLDANLLALSSAWFLKSNEYKYSYHFEALGRPIIQYPQDMAAMQELIWKIKPDLIVETGIAHGGSLIMSASMLAMLDYCDAVAEGKMLDPLAAGRKVVGIDIDIREHNRQAIEAHPLSHKIEMIQGSSIDSDIIERVKKIAAGYSKVLVCLDSNHTHQHVLAELQAYAPMVSKGSYCVVFDTVIEDMPVDSFPDRPWGVGNNPKTAVRAYLSELIATQAKAMDGERLKYVIDKNIENKLLITVATDGYLQRV